MVLVLAVLASAGTGPARPVAAPRYPSPAVSPSPSPPPASPWPSPSLTAVALGPPVHRISGYLHAFGTQLVDAKNHPVGLVTIQINGMQHGNGTPDTVPQAYSGCHGWRAPDPVAYKLIEEWGFNSARVQITWANLESIPPTKGSNGKLTHHWNSGYLQAVDDIVNGLAKRGVAVILEMNQVRWSPSFVDIPTPSGGKLCGTGMPTWLYGQGLGIGSIAPVEKDFFANKGGVQDLFIAAWKFLVRRYAKQELMIGADILNEPYDMLVQSYPGGTGVKPHDIDLRGFYEKVGSAINAVNPNLLLIFEENRSRRTGKWSVVDRPDLPNAVLSFHWYPTEWTAPEGLDRLRRYVDRAKAWDVPSWIGEFNAFRYTSRVPALSTWAGDLEKFLAYAKKNNLGWTIASYGSGQIQEPDSDQVKPEIISILRAGFSPGPH